MGRAQSAGGPPDGERETNIAFCNRPREHSGEIAGDGERLDVLTRIHRGNRASSGLRRSGNGSREWDRAHESTVLYAGCLHFFDVGKSSVRKNVFGSHASIEQARPK